MATDQNETRDSHQKDQQKLCIYQIGNSYTKSNNLPQLVQQVFLASGRTNVHIDSHNPPGESFRGHVRNLTGKGPKGADHPLHRAMCHKPPTNHWNWIILQNQSQVPGLIQDDPGTFEQSVESAHKIHQLIQEHNPRVRFMFLMTWGRCRGDKTNASIFPDFPTMQSKVTAGYLHYVQATSTPECPTFVAPCGLVFQTIYNDDLKLQENQNPTASGSLFRGLFVQDGHHPSLAGSYVAAVTIYASLTGNDASQLQWGPNDLDPAVAAQLRDAVSRTIQETLYSGLIRYPWQGDTNTVWNVGWGES